MMAKSADNEAEHRPTDGLFGCVEAGGTKFVVGIVSAAHEILDAVHCGNRLQIIRRMRLSAGIWRN